MQNFVRLGALIYRCFSNMGMDVIKHFSPILEKVDKYVKKFENVNKMFLPQAYSGYLSAKRDFEAGGPALPTIDSLFDRMRNLPKFSRQHNEGHLDIMERRLIADVAYCLSGMIIHKENLSQGLDKLPTLSCVFLQFLTAVFDRVFNEPSKADQLEMECMCNALQSIHYLLKVDGATEQQLFDYNDCYLYLFRSLSGRCAECHQIAQHKCSKCGIIRYCSADCQKGGWARHKTVCGKEDSQAMKIRFIQTKPFEKLFDRLIKEGKIKVGVAFDNKKNFGPIVILQ
jgi:hypothetical protein